MRTFVLLAALATAITLTAAAAGAQAQPTTSLATARPHVGAGQAVVLAGRLSNRGSGVTVAVYARPFTATRTARIATVRTDATGRWVYTTRPQIQTTYQARVGSKSSPSLTVRVRPSLALQVAPSGAVIASVSPRSLHGRSVRLQRLTTTGTWTTVAKVPLNAAGKVVFAPAGLPTGSSHLRLVMSVNQAGAGYLGGFSHPIVYQAHAVSLAKTPVQVGYGDSLQLTGHISLAKSGVPLEILARPFMQESFQQVATIRTTADGAWQYRITPPFTTSYVARWGNGQSRTLTVGVRPAMSVQLTSGNRISAHVGLAKSVAGKTIQLQQRQANGVWHTVARLHLNPRATAVFTPSRVPAGTSTLRTAISVNQVGAGFLGGFSRPFVYHR